MKNFSDREESLKERLMNRDNFLKSIGIFMKNETDYPAAVSMMLDSQQSNVVGPDFLFNQKLENKQTVVS